MFLGKGLEHFECQLHVMHKLNLKYRLSYKVANSKVS